MKSQSPLVPRREKDLTIIFCECFSTMSENARLELCLLGIVIVRQPGDRESLDDGWTLLAEDGGDLVQRLAVIVVLFEHATASQFN